MKTLQKSSIETPPLLRSECLCERLSQSQITPIRHSVGGVVTLLGKSPALMIFQQGEEYGISQYEDALEDE